MKSKSKSLTLKKKKDFRYHNIQVLTKKGATKNIRHPTYVFYERGNIYIYMPLTHSKCVPNLVVVKLKKNPNPNDTRDSYLVVDIKEDSKSTFGKRRKKWKMSLLDDIKIRKMYKKR